MGTTNRGSLDRMRNVMKRYLAGKKEGTFVSSLESARASLKALQPDLLDYLESLDLQWQGVDGPFERESLPFVDADKLEEIYQVGRGLFKNRQTREARDLFLLVVYLDNENGIAFLSLGIAEQVLKNHQAAIEAYALATQAQPSNPAPYLYSAECCLVLNEHREASRFVEASLQVMERYHHPAHLKHALRLKKLLAEKK